MKEVSGRVTAEAVVEVVDLIITLLIITNNHIGDHFPLTSLQVEISDLHLTISLLVRFVVTCNMKEVVVVVRYNSIEDHLQNHLERFDHHLTPSLLGRFVGIHIMKIIITTVTYE